MTDKTFILNQYDHSKVCTCVMGTNATLMCPKCYATYPIKQFGAISASSLIAIDLLAHVEYHIQCAKCDNDVTAIVLDPPTAYAVSSLNKLGYITEMSCSGHVDDDVNPAFIKFKEVPEFETFPVDWELSGVFLRARTTEHKDAISKLNAWIAGLLKEV